MGLMVVHDQQDLVLYRTIDILRKIFSHLNKILTCHPQNGNFDLAIITKGLGETLVNVQNVLSLPIRGVLKKSWELLQSHL